MDSLRIKNLRSLADTKTIKFKRINVFVGQNSSGKSSFIRTFPLLKQSAQVKTVSDILWYGPFVDFGSFEEALNRDADQNKIEFTFSMKARPRRLRYRFKTGTRVGNQSLPVTLKLSIRPDKSSTRGALITEYAILVHEKKIKLALNEKLEIVEFVCGEIDFSEQARKAFFFFRTFGLIPVAGEFSNLSDEHEWFDDQIAKLLERHVHGNKSTETLRNMVSDLVFGSAENILSQLRSFNLGTYWSNNLDTWTEDDEFFEEITSHIYARDFQYIFEAIGDHVTDVSNAIQYVTPLRATAERYYRIQGLSVSEIDPQGTNLAMFLKNLSEEQANSFAEWTANSMGFEVRAETLQGHVSIVISDAGSSKRMNLADTGFGYSQVLPVLAQLWRLSIKRTPPHIPKFFAIEQPELHLHPRMQARLAELFADLVSISKKKPRASQFKLLIETHSEIIINQLGKAIEAGDLSPEDVGIYIFEKKGLDGQTVVRESKFDADGYLIDWPYGFFDSARP